MLWSLAGCERIHEEQRGISQKMYLRREALAEELLGTKSRVNSCPQFLISRSFIFFYAGCTVFVILQGVAVIPGFFWKPSVPIYDGCRVLVSLQEFAVTVSFFWEPFCSHG